LETLRMSSHGASGSHSSLNQMMMTESPGISPIREPAIPKGGVVMSGAVDSATPPKSMREMLGLKDSSATSSPSVMSPSDDAQKQREKTA